MRAARISTPKQKTLTLTLTTLLPTPNDDHFGYFVRGVQVVRMGCVPARGGNGDSRNVSRSKPSLNCRKRPWEGALYNEKRLCRYACGTA